MKKRRISISLTKSLLDQYTETAKRHGISRNALMAIALKQYMNEKKYYFN